MLQTYSSIYLYLLLILGLLFFFVFALIEKKADCPLIKVSLFSNRAFVINLLSIAIAFVSIGTYNIMYVWRVVGVKFLQTFGITPSEDLWERTKNLTTEQTIELFKSEYGIVWTDEEIRVGINNLVGQMYREEVLPKNGVKELLEMFRERGVKMCVASATDGYLVDLVLRKNGMRDYFSRIISCGSGLSGRRNRCFRAGRLYGYVRKCGA